MSIKSASQSDNGLQMHFVLLEMHVLQYSSKLGMCGGVSVSQSLSTKFIKILGGYPIPLLLVMNVPESETELWGSPFLLWQDCLCLLEWIFTLLLTLFQGLYFSLLGCRSLCKVKFPHFVFIFSLTSTMSLGIWHTRNPWKSQAAFNCCG